MTGCSQPLHPEHTTGNSPPQQLIHTLVRVSGGSHHRWGTLLTLGQSCRTWNIEMISCASLLPRKVFVSSPDRWRRRARSLDGGYFVISGVSRQLLGVGLEHWRRWGVHTLSLVWDLSSIKMYSIQSEGLPLSLELPSLMASSPKRSVFSF